MNHTVLERRGGLALRGEIHRFETTFETTRSKFAFGLAGVKLLGLLVRAPLTCAQREWPADQAPAQRPCAARRVRIGHKQILAVTQSADGFVLIFGREL